MTEDKHSRSERHTERLDHEADEIIGVEDRLEELAGRAGVASLMKNDRLDGGELLKVLGGVRGLTETLLPGVVFVVVYAITRQLGISLGASLGLSVVFVIIRVFQRTQTRSALAGLVAASASAAVALLTGNPTDNYLISIILNGVYGGALLLSLLVGWPILGLFVGFLMGDGVAWRKDSRKLRVMSWLTLMWVGLFALRLAIELPLYFANDVVALGVVRLILGTPFYALFLVLTWVAARGLYPNTHAESAE